MAKNVEALINEVDSFIKLTGLSPADKLGVGLGKAFTKFYLNLFKDILQSSSKYWDNFLTKIIHEQWTYRETMVQIESAHYLDLEDDRFLLKEINGISIENTYMYKNHDVRNILMLAFIASNKCPEEEYQTLLIFMVERLEECLEECKFPNKSKFVRSFK